LIKKCYHHNIEDSLHHQQPAINACFSSLVIPSSSMEKHTVRATDATTASSSYPEENLILARQIVETVKSRGGRFLERGGVPDGTSTSCLSYYREVEDSVAVEKTKHSFRHQMRTIEQEDGRVEDTARSTKRKRGATEENVVLNVARHNASTNKYQRHVMPQMRSCGICDRSVPASRPLFLAHQCSLLSDSERLMIALGGGMHHHQLDRTPIPALHLLGPHQNGMQGVQAPLLLRLPSSKLLNPEQEVNRRKQALFLNGASTLAASQEYSLGPADLLSYSTMSQYHLLSSKPAPLYPSVIPATSTIWKAQQRAEEEKVFMRRHVSMIQAKRNAEIARDLALFLTR
jgi:hypothetical protein